MSDLDRQTEDLIAALESQLVDDLDSDLADDLRATIAQVKARRDAKLRGDVQRTIGETHLTLREAMDRMVSQMAGFSEDFQAWRTDQESTADQQSRLVLGLQSSLVKREAADAGFISAIQEGATAVNELRSEFQQGMAAVGEYVDHLAGVQAEHGQRLDGHDKEHTAAGHRMDAFEVQIGVLKDHIARLERELGYRSTP